MTAPQKFCLHCGAALVRNGTGRPPQRRSFCGNDCAASFRVGKKTAKRDNTKLCVCGCGVVLAQRPNETPARWAKRRYASNGCWARHRATPIDQRDHKTCECCNARFMRPHNVTKAAWAIRRFCSHDCRVRWGQKHGRTAASRTAALTARGASPTAAPTLPTGARPSRVCACCGDEFNKPSSMSHREWNARRFCSISCSNRGRVTVRRTPDEMRELRQRSRRAKLLAQSIQAAKEGPAAPPIGKCQSVEEWLAAGGQVTRCPTAILVAVPGGIEIDAADRAAIEQHSQRTIAQTGAHVMRAPQSKRG